MTNPSQNRPSSRSKAPDPARSYERAKPEAESGMGRLDNNDATPTNRQDKMGQAVKNKQPPRSARRAREGREGTGPL